MRYFATVSDIEAALRRRRSAEQFLGGTEGQAQVRWLELRPDSGACCLYVHIVQDVGHEEYLDIYGFPYADGGDEGRCLGTFASAQDAIAFCASEFSAALDGWVNQGVTQDDYAWYVHQGRPHPWRPVI